MDQPSKSRITQNIVYMKSTLTHLDPIIDRLIASGIFGLADRNRIEAVSAPYKQFNTFIDILTASPEPNAYRIFRKALKLEGYATVAEELDQTTPQPPAVRSASSRQSRTNDSIANNDGTAPDGAGASGRNSSSNRCPDCTTGGSTVINALETFSRNQQVFMDDIQRLRNEDFAKIEEQRMRGKDDLQKQFEMWKNAHDQDASAIVMRYISLQEEFEHLKEVQKGMRSIDSERREKLKILNKDHVILNTKYQELQQAYDDLEKDMFRMKNLLSNQEINYAVEEGDISGKNANIVDKLMAEKHDLMLGLEEKIAEIETLQKQLDQQKDMRERDQSEQENVQLTSKTEHERKFDKLYEMVETMAKEKSLAVDDTPKPAQQQKVTQAFKTTRMQLKERKPAPIKMQGTKPFKVLGLDC